MAALGRSFIEILKKHLLLMAKMNRGIMDSNIICTIAFENCMDSLGDVLGLQEVNVDKIYIFSNICGKLTKDAEAEFIQAFSKNEKAEVIYADESYPTPIPWYKPDFSPDTLESFFYIGNIFAIRGSVLKNMPRESSLYEIVLNMARASLEFVHIPKVLFINNTDEEKDKLYGYEEVSFKQSESIDVLKGDKRVSVIIPSKDNSQILGKCISSLTDITEYKNYEIIVVDNGSCDEQRLHIKELADRYGFRYIYDKYDFNFSKMCNIGAKLANGNYLLFLNDDIEIINGNWLHNMLLSASKSHVGAVGAKLYYPDYRIQHVGITNMGIGPAHKLCGELDDKNLYHGHNRANYNMLAVTGACLMIKQQLFMELGGFDENFPIAYNDVELCFRLHKKGYYNVVRNDATLIHHESVSRGEDTSTEKKRRLIYEKRRLYEKYPDLKAYDPYYSPNLVQWKWDSDYNENIINDYDKEITPVTIDGKELKKLPKEHDNKYIQKLTGENLLMFNIDGVDYIDGVENMYNKNMLLIRGWVALRERDNADEKCRKQLLLKHVSDEKIVYRLEIHSKQRIDVAGLFDANTSNAVNTGINVFFDVKALQKGKYMVGVLLEAKRQYVKWSTQTIDIDY
jgi:GT2 family glycosyltransferase